MVADSIERETLIAAPVEVVWGVVTEPDQIARWFSDIAEIDLRPGGEGTLTFGATNERATVRIVVQSVEPPHTFAFRWISPPAPVGAQPVGADAREGNSLLVEFTLIAEGDNTRLRVVESGLLAMAWSEESKAKYHDEHSEGWANHLARLRDCAPEQYRASAQR